MANVDIQSLGYRFVQVCLKNYWGECAFLVLFFIGLVWTMLYRKKDISKSFLLYTVCLGLTVYNPLFVKYVVPVLGFENEYYRFFWMLPVVPVVSYYMVRLVFCVKRSFLKAVIAVCCTSLIVITGVPLEGVAKNYAMIENIYKVPDELRAVCAVIREDSEKENPKVVFSHELNNVARQYDPSLFLTLDRDAIIYRSGSTIAGKFNEEKAWYQRQKTIMDLVYYEMDVTKKAFTSALKKTKTDYLVLRVNITIHDYIRECGCEPLAQTANYVVYRYNWE